MCQSFPTRSPEEPNSPRGFVLPAVRTLWACPPALPRSMSLLSLVPGRWWRCVAVPQGTWSSARDLPFQGAAPPDELSGTDSGVDYQAPTPSHITGELSASDQGHAPAPRSL